MSQFQTFISRNSYFDSTGAKFEFEDDNVTGGSVDTVDMTWDIGDKLNDVGPLLYQGHYLDSGNLFLVFGDGTVTSIYSPDVLAADSGYPADLSGLPTLVTTSLATCFCTGTLISTPLGEVVVEELKVGDRIDTPDGEVAVKWIGRQTVSTRFGPADRLMPVRIAAGALEAGVPHTDLTVTADHAMLVDGVLCNAGALVNGTTITRVPLAEMGKTYTVYHIETEAHEIILANGAPAETFIDNVSRRVFDNYAEFEALYGDVPEMEELPLPRAMSARQVPSVVRNRLGGLLRAARN